jgi:perosamine synthetase
VSVARAVTEKLALHGGIPVRPTLLSYGRQSIDEEDIQAVVNVLRSDWLTTGPKVAEFEEAFAATVGAKYSVSFSSGTAALHAAVFAAGVTEEDEAITSPMTFCATANAVLHQGASLAFADVSPDTLNIDPAQVERRITRYTRAILPVDYAGHPADLGAILGIAERYGLVVIEDACHALGARHRERLVGSIAHMTVFSFHPVKHITTGEGGMVTTDDGEFARRLRLFRNHGISSEARERQTKGQWHYEMVTLGLNYRLTDIGCALALGQLRRLSPNVARRQKIAARYTSALSTIPGVITPAVRESVDPAWHLYPIRLAGDFDRGEVFRALRAENIGVNVHYIPVHLHPYYRDRFGFKRGDFPVAEAAYEGLISLPMFHAMSDEDVEDVINAVAKVMYGLSREVA